MSTFPLCFNIHEYSHTTLFHKTVINTEVLQTEKEDFKMKDDGKMVEDDQMKENFKKKEDGKVKENDKMKENGEVKEIYKMKENGKKERGYVKR